MKQRGKNNWSPMSEAIHNVPALVKGKSRNVMNGLKALLEVLLVIEKLSYSSFSVY